MTLQVISGLGVYKEGGYGALKSDQYAVVSTIEFELYSYDPSGVIMYAPLLGTAVSKNINFCFNYVQVMLIFRACLFMLVSSMGISI